MVQGKQQNMRIGLHVSIAGHIYESLERAKSLGCDTMQIFSRNPRGWQASEMPAADTAEFKKLKTKYGVAPVAVHIPYIINLATPDEKLYEKSIAAYIEDIQRADELGAEYFVTHLGSHTESGEENGLRRFSEALAEILKKARPKTMVLLENTAGSGSWIGYRFEHLRRIMDDLGALSKGVGVCLDTAHTFEAGYDIRTKAGLDSTLKKLERIVGIGRVKVVHFNDSLSELGSRVDRHQHIGKGNIGLAAMGRIINHPLLKNSAFIMETPKETERDDRMNMRIARRLAKA
jgi:deoxyribonuclease IV